MGKLAFWSGVAGAAKGGLAATATKIDEERDTRRDKMETMRMERLENLRSKHAKELQSEGHVDAKDLLGTRHGQTKDILDLEFEHEKGMQEDQQDFTGTEQDDQQEFLTEEKHKQRASNERMPFIEGDAEVYTTKRLMEELGITPKGLENSGLDISFEKIEVPVKDRPGLFRETQGYAIKNLGSIFIKEGNYMVPQGTDDEVKASGISEFKAKIKGNTTREQLIVKRLKEMNEAEGIDYASQIMERFGIVPLRVIQVLAN